MSIFGKIANFLTGGIGEKIVETVAGQFPEKLSDAEKAQINAAILAATREHDLKLQQIALETDAEFNNRIKALEGTASDLQHFGIVGRIVVFLRGMQRPVWGFFVLFMNAMVFSGEWTLVNPNAPDVDMYSAFVLINGLVLGFLFGERALKNTGPLIAQMLGRGS